MPSVIASFGKLWGTGKGVLLLRTQGTKSKKKCLVFTVLAHYAMMLQASSPVLIRLTVHVPNTVGRCYLGSTGWSVTTAKMKPTSISFGLTHAQQPMIQTNAWMKSTRLQQKLNPVEIGAPNMGGSSALIWSWPILEVIALAGPRSGVWSMVPSVLFTVPGDTLTLNSSDCFLSAWKYIAAYDPPWTRITLEKLLRVQ